MIKHTSLPLPPLKLQYKYQLSSLNQVQQNLCVTGPALFNCQIWKSVKGQMCYVECNMFMDNTMCLYFFHL